VDVPKYRHHEFPISIAMATPAVRMVAVEVFAQKKDDGGWEDDCVRIFPVLALVAKQFNKYIRENDSAHNERGTHPTHEGMESRGWHFMGADTQYDVVIMTSDFFITQADGSIGSSENTIHEVVCCPWPPEEDTEQLRPLIERLTTEIRGKVAKHPE
jgi:hypothetical protein